MFKLTLTSYCRDFAHFYLQQARNQEEITSKFSTSEQIKSRSHYFQGPLSDWGECILARNVAQSPG